MKISKVLATKPCIVNKSSDEQIETTKPKENVTKVVNPTTSTLEQLGKVINTVKSNKKEDQKVIICLEIELCKK